MCNVALQELSKKSETNFVVPEAPLEGLSSFSETRYCVTRKGRSEVPLFLDGAVPVTIAEDHNAAAAS